MAHFIGIVAHSKTEGWLTLAGQVAQSGQDYSNSIDDIRMSFTYRMSKDYLPQPDKIFPFGETGGGDLFLFDYRKNSDVPEIIFLDHENAVTEDDLIEDDFEEKSLDEWLEGNFYKTGNSFSEFLESLKLNFIYLPGKLYC